MWCANCQDDVATEIAQDGQSLKCTACGDVVREVFAPSLHPETKSARELLEKWAGEKKQPRQQTVAPVVSETTPDAKTPTDDRSTLDPHDVQSDEIRRETDEVPDQPIDEQQPTEVSKPSYRVDPSHDTEYMLHGSRKSSSRRFLPRTSNSEDQAKTQPNPLTGQSPDHVESPQRDKIESHSAHALPAPHFDMEFARRKARTRPGRAESIWGQLLAYLGVGVLTIGSVLVLWGYFGMVEQYASTGWLLSTAGQMLLLLGVVTLVSGGMQQTQHEVSERIEYLGGRMIRIEQSTEQLLKGPHYLRSGPSSETHQPETSTSQSED